MVVMQTTMLFDNQSLMFPDASALCLLNYFCTSQGHYCASQIYGLIRVSECVGFNDVPLNTQ